MLYSSFNKQNEADAMSYSIVFNKWHEMLSNAGLALVEISIWVLTLSFFLCDVHWSVFNPWTPLVSLGSESLSQTEGPAVVNTKAHSLQTFTIHLFYFYLPLVFPLIYFWILFMISYKPLQPLGETWSQIKKKNYIKQINGRRTEAQMKCYRSLEERMLEGPR